MATRVRARSALASVCSHAFRRRAEELYGLGYRQHEPNARIWARVGGVGPRERVWPCGWGASGVPCEDVAVTGRERTRHAQLPASLSYWCRAAGVLRDCVRVRLA